MDKDYTRLEYYKKFGQNDYDTTLDELLLYGLFCDGFSTEDIQEVANAIGISYQRFGDIVRKETSLGLGVKDDEGNGVFCKEPKQLDLEFCAKYDFKYRSYTLEKAINTYYKLDIEKEDGSGVYGIYDGCDLKYIGRSVECKQRFITHLLNALSPYYDSGAKKVKEYIQQNGRTLRLEMIEHLPKDNILLHKQRERFGIEKEKPVLNTVYLEKKIAEGKYI